MFHPLTLAAWLSIHGVAVALALATYVVTSLALRQRRHPSAAVAWVVSLALAPYIALPLFLVFGLRKTVRPARSAAPVLPASAGAARGLPGARLEALGLGLGMPPAVPYRDLVVHDEADVAFERLLRVLYGARHTLDVSTFLLGNDAVGAQVCALLQQRAQEGVAVRLLIDGVGFYIGKAPSLRALRRAGVQVRLFASPWLSPLPGSRANFRNHRKIVAADGEWAWAGGRNLAAEYFQPTELGNGSVRPPWIDLSFDLRGPLVAHMAQQFDIDWVHAARGKAPAFRPELPQSPGPPAGSGLAQFLPSGPDQSDDTVHALLVDACFNARRRLLAVTPYFVPDPVLLMALVLAARRGITVDLVVPQRSNHRLADLARPAALRQLLQAGARVWLTPRMLHAKLVVVDHAVAFCGSMNLDERSLFLNYEAMVAFYDHDAITAFARWARRLREDSDQLPYAPVGVVREFGEGLLRWLTFQL